MSNIDTSDVRERISLLQIAQVFARIGLTSFGGGLTSWVYMEAVEKRQWLREEEFFAGLAISQILPGPNVLNLSIFIGQRLRGIAGSLTAVLSLLLPPMAVVVAVAMLIHRSGINAGVHSFLEGIAAGAVGLTLCVGIRSLRNAARQQYWPLVIAGLTFVGIGLLHWPLSYVVLGLLPVAFALAWRSGNRV